MVRHHMKFTLPGILLALFTKDNLFSVIMIKLFISTAADTVYWPFLLPVLLPRGFLSSDFHCFIEINRQKNKIKFRNSIFSSLHCQCNPQTSSNSKARGLGTLVIAKYWVLRPRTRKCKTIFEGNKRGGNVNFAT